MPRYRRTWTRKRSANESHLHALTIHLDDADTITTSCKAMINGKKVEEHATTLKREKS